MENLEKLRGVFRRAFLEVGVFSLVVNTLLLVLPLYMLQIYDRVIPSSSFETLIYLSIIATCALLVLGCMEAVRGYYATRLGARMDADLGPAVLKSMMRTRSADLGDMQPLRDLTAAKNFISSRSAFILFDLPFTPLFIGIIYLIHPALFLLTVAGTCILVAVVFLNQWMTGRQSRQAAEESSKANVMAQHFVRSAETVRALGMASNVIERWGDKLADGVNRADSAARVNTFFTGLSRSLRMLLQISILGTGAYLVLNGEMTAGMIFASSIISGRALQPLDQLIAGWKPILEAWRSWRRLTTFLKKGADADAAHIRLPAPVGEIRVERLVYHAPGAKQGEAPIIKGIGFHIPAGNAVGIVGPSRAGKSTLARLVVGAIQANSGVVRLDDADIRNWDPDRLGRSIGYLAQEVEFLPGTIAENISRFEAGAPDELIVEAAKAAGVHELILSKRDGYATALGAGGGLSGGERQRIALARALYGDPKLLVLDEPNANLDADGEQALAGAVARARERGATVIIITHRISITRNCDRVMVMRDGQIENYGPSAEILGKLNSQNNVASARPAEAAQAKPAPAANWSVNAPGNIVRMPREKTEAADK